MSIPKRVVRISLGSTSRGPRVEIELLGQRILIECVGADGNVRPAKALYEELDGSGFKNVGERQVA